MSVRNGILVGAVLAIAVPAAFAVGRKIGADPLRARVDSVLAVSDSLGRVISDDPYLAAGAVNVAINALGHGCLVPPDVWALHPLELACPSGWRRPR